MIDKHSRRRDNSEQTKPSLGRSCSVLIVDTSGLFREGLAEILKTYHFEVLAVSASVQDAVSEMETDYNSARIDLAILTLDPNRNIGPQLAAIQILRRRDLTSKVVLLMPTCTTEDLVAAVLCGVDGLILKDISSETLVSALDLVMHGQHVLPLGVASQLFARIGEPSRPVAGGEPPVPPPSELATCTSVFKAADAAGARDTGQLLTRNLALSDRETQILQCLVEGCANKLIARRLEIAEATVKVHIKGLLRKINVSNRTQAAIWALSQSVTTRKVHGSEPSYASGVPSGRAPPAETAAEEAAASDVIAVFPSGGKKLALSSRA